MRAFHVAPSPKFAIVASYGTRSPVAGKPDEAAVALEQALERNERKSNRVSTLRAQTRLAELQAAAPR